jgi:hypothetical protein
MYFYHLCDENFIYFQIAAMALHRQTTKTSRRTILKTIQKRKRKKIARNTVAAGPEIGIAAVPNEVGHGRGANARVQKVETANAGMFCK